MGHSDGEMIFLQDKEIQIFVGICEYWDLVVELGHVPNGAGGTTSRVARAFPFSENYFQMKNPRHEL